MNSFFIALVLRARNRSLFADCVAARRSAERWAAARMQLQQAFQRVIPPPVATRIVQAGTASMLRRPDVNLAESEDRSWINYDYETSDAVVLAIALGESASRSSRLDSAETLAASMHTALAVSEALTAICADRKLLQFRCGDVFLVVDLEPSATNKPAERRKALRDLADDLRELPALSAGCAGAALLTGLSMGRVEGALCGKAPRRYEITGFAVTNAIETLAVVTPR
jgi:hypothetical protein